MTQQEAIILIRKIERMDRAVRAEGSALVQERWFELQHLVRRTVQVAEVKESM